MSVFKIVRYFIQMIFEIFKDISAFMIILVVSVVAYAQVSMIFKTLDSEHKVDIESYLRSSYLLTLGELGDDIKDSTTTYFIIFTVFSFFIPILLLNMLIAIMSDSYERVMANKIPADCRQLASMLLEMEQIVNYFNIKLRGKNIENDYKFIIYS